MNTKYTCLLISVFFLLMGCRKSMTSAPAGFSQNPTSYELVSEVWSGPVTNGQSYLFTYDDSTHLLTSYKRIQWGQGGYNITDSGNFPLPGFSDTSYFHLTYSDGRISRLYSSDGGAQGYAAFEYNSKGWLVKSTNYFLNGQPQDYVYLYSYNDKGQVTGMRETNTSTLNFHYTFAYDNNGNLVKEVDSTLYTHPPLIYMTEYSDYDNKVSSIRALNGYGTTYAGDYNLGSGSSIPSNNVGSASYYTNTNGSPDFGPPSTVLYNYQYNDEGLPVQIQSGPWTITLQYKKYK